MLNRHITKIYNCLGDAEISKEGRKMGNIES